MGLGFTDPRPFTELLNSDRPPRSLKFIKKNPVPPKIRALMAKVKGKLSAATTSTGVTSIGKAALRGAAKVAVAASANKVLGAITGKLGKPFTSVKKLATAASTGVLIAEELREAHLKRPLFEGPAINGLRAGKQLAETTAQGVMGSLIGGVPLANGLPPAVKIFKTLTSLKASPRYFNPRATSTVAANTVATTGTIIVTPQRGLLEDEIVYRLTLLAENVYEPLAKYATEHGLGRPEIIEALRSENTGISQHEKGEAMDITLPLAANLYALAVWARDNVLYDQLILCYTARQTWLHVSFSPETRRREVLTKLFNDEFIQGLHVVGAYTDMTLLSSDKAAAAANDVIANDMIQRLAARDSRLSPVGVNTPEQTSGLITNVPSSSGSSGTVGGGGFTSENGCIDNPTTSVYEAIVSAAQTQAEVAALTVVGGIVTSEAAYTAEVCGYINATGTHEATNGLVDEVWVKLKGDTNFSEHWDIVTASGTIWTHHAATCIPAKF